MTTSTNNKPEWRQRTAHPDAEFHLAYMDKHVLYVKEQSTGSWRWWIVRHEATPEKAAAAAGMPPLPEGTAPYLTQAKDAALNTYNREVK